MKGVIYSRVSTDDQEYARQTEDLVKYASANGITLICDPLEEKESGFNDDRPKFNELLKFTKEDVDIILVWELTRLSRKSIKLQETVRNFMDKGIRIFAYKDNFSTHNPDGSESEMAKMVLAMVATMAESEAKTLKERTMAGRFHKIVAEGHSYTTKKLLGYDIVDGKLVINEEEAEIVRQMFNLCIEGYSATRIARTLKVQDKVKVWGSSSVQVYLHNPTYKGERVYTSKSGRTATIKTPAIVSEEVWDKAQECIDARAISRVKGTVRNPSKSLLRGILVCPACGRKFTKSFDTYKCVSNANIAYDRCGSTTIKDTKLDPAVWNLVTLVCQDMLNDDYKEKHSEPIRANIKQLLKNAEAIASSIKYYQGEAKKHYNVAVKMQEINPSLYETSMNKIKELSQLEQASNAEMLSITEQVAIEEAKLKAIAEGTNYVITEATEKCTFVHNVLESGYVYGNRSRKAIHFTFKTGEQYDLLYYNKQWYYIKNNGNVTFIDCLAKSKENPELPDTLVSVENLQVGEVTLNATYSLEDFTNILYTHNLLTKC